MALVLKDACPRFSCIMLRNWYCAEASYVSSSSIVRRMPSTLRCFHGDMASAMAEVSLKKSLRSPAKRLWNMISDVFIVSFADADGGEC